MNRIALMLIGIFFINLNVFFVSALNATINVPEKYTDVYAGERFYFQTDVNYAENIERIDLRLIYTISEKDGEEVAHLKVLKAVKKHASFVDFIVIPEQIKEGMYILNVNIQDYANLNRDISTSFYVKTNKTMQIEKYFLIIIPILFIFIMLVSWEIYILKKS